MNQRRTPSNVHTIGDNDEDRAPAGRRLARSSSESSVEILPDPDERD